MTTLNEHGGAILTYGALTIDKAPSLITVRRVEGGGAINIRDGSLTVSNNTFTGNISGGARAIYNYSGQTTITNKHHCPVITTVASAICMGTSLSTTALWPTTGVPTIALT
ncbi:MAG: hypothetical protein R3C44_21195 [Chloroflexota bacterium]